MNYLSRIFDDERRRHDDIMRRLHNPNLFVDYYMDGMDYYPWYEEADRILIDSGWYSREIRQRFAIMMLPAGVGKTLRYSVVEALMEICNDRYSTRHCVLSKSQGKAKNIMLGIKNNLEHNDRIIEDFGEFVDPSLPWNTDELWVKGHDPKATTPTVANIGATGQVESMRFTSMIPDDLVDLETALSPTETEKTVQRITDTYMQRLDPGGKFLVIGHRFSFHDPYGFILPMTYFRGSTYIKSALGDNGESNFPYRFPTSKYQKDRENTNDARFQAIFQQRPIEGGNEFDIRWLLDTVTTQMPSGVVVAIDPAYTTLKKNDYMGGVALGKYHDKDTGQNLKILVGLMGLRTASNFSSHIENFMRKNNTRRGTVETNNAKTLGDEMRKMGYQIKDYTASENKIWRIGRLQPEMKNGTLRIHESVLGTPEWELLKEELLYFPNGGHEHILDALAQGVERLNRGGLAFAAI